jgi:hypothetical protein
VRSLVSCYPFHNEAGSNFVRPSFDARPFDRIEGGSSTALIVQAAATDVVKLEGLQFNGAGIQLVSGGHLHVARCVITNGNAAGNAGISFLPSSASIIKEGDTPDHTPVLFINKYTGMELCFFVPHGGI